MPRTYVNYIVIIKCIYKVCYNEMKQYEVIAKMPIISEDAEDADN